MVQKVGSTQPIDAALRFNHERKHYDDDLATLFFAMRMTYLQDKKHFHSVDIVPGMFELAKKMNEILPRLYLTPYELQRAEYESFFGVIIYN